MTDKLRSRIRELPVRISRIGNLRSIYRLGRHYDMANGFHDFDYAVCIKKNGQSFLARVASFDAVLRDAMIEGETLRYDNQTFLIVGPDYRICYAFEGYKKQCDKLGYMKDGNPQFRMLQRMGVSLVVRYCRLRGYDRDEIEAHMFNGDWTVAYPNPADRYVAIYRNIHASKRLSCRGSCCDARQQDRTDT